MYFNKHITVIIPALNEAAAIGLVIADVPDCVDHIIVVDNGSFDDTAGIAKSHGATVIVEHRKGYGAACIAGLKGIVSTDLIGFIDGDYSDYPGELTQVITPVARGEADLSIGCRHNRDQKTPSGLYWHQRLGNWLACGFVRYAYGYQVTDFGPMRCLRWDALERLNMCDQDYGWTAEMQIKAIKNGFRILEVPVNYRPRIGESKISGTLKGSIFAGYKIFYWAIRLLFSTQNPLSNNERLKAAP
ncbi:MAG: glycosyltransferase [Gammaproteobacteria bacterium]|nr:glycosyltransferase [Gammaproteobacteria bacterium]